jgi:leucyl aminopeptidase
MKISLSTESITSVKADILAVGVHAKKVGSDETVKKLDKAMGGALLAHAKDEDFQGQAGETLKVPTSGSVGAKWVVLVGLGTGRSTPRSALTVAVTGALAAKRQRTLAVVLPVSDEEGVRAAAEGAVTGAYRYDEYLTGARKPHGGVTSTILVGAKNDAVTKRAAAEGQAIGESINLARDLVNAPPNDMNPPALAQAAVKASAGTKIKCTVWNKKQIEKAGMRLLMAVNQGSGTEPRFVHMVYKPARAKAKVAFVGKGLTFDSGGLCIKPAKAMLDMKCDMAGAATTIGVVLAAAKIGLPVEVHGIIGSTENMSGDFAYRPGDVFKSLDGKTVEIINTDAEGRLVLADVLTWTRDHVKPDYMIDHATLTGACMVALGRWRAGLFANDDRFGKAYDAAAERVAEHFWRLPLDEDLFETLKSDIADIKHTGDSHGGAITAALFLREFVGDTKWIHCDIAGPAFLDRAHAANPKGGTGFGIATGIEFLRSLAEK